MSLLDRHPLEIREVIWSFLELRDLRRVTATARAFSDEIRRCAALWEPYLVRWFPLSAAQRLPKGGAVDDPESTCPFRFGDTLNEGRPPFPLGTTSTSAADLPTPPIMDFIAALWQAYPTTFLASCSEEEQLKSEESSASLFQRLRRFFRSSTPPPRQHRRNHNVDVNEGAVMIVGDIGSGKTSIFRRLPAVMAVIQGAASDSIPEAIPFPTHPPEPTMGFNIPFTITGHKGDGGGGASNRTPSRVQVWDWGGSPAVRALWPRVYGSATGLICVIDAFSPVRDGEEPLLRTTALLDEVLGHPDTQQKPLLVLLNHPSRQTSGRHRPTITAEQVCVLLRNALSKRMRGGDLPAAPAPAPAQQHQQQPWRIQPCCAVTDCGVSDGVAWLLRHLSMEHVVQWS